MLELRLPQGGGHGPARDEGDLETVFLRVLLSGFQERKCHAVAGSKFAPINRHNAAPSCHDGKTGYNQKASQRNTDALIGWQ
jgi:hypothetical protein